MDDYIRKRPTLKLWVRFLLIIIISVGMFFPLAKIYINTVKNKQNKYIYN